jgi:hypothetical protein
MKKRAASIDVDDCIDRLQAAVDALASEGVHEAYVSAALLQVTIRAVKKSRDPAKALDQAAHMFLEAAERAFEGAKQDRAKKRAKRLGLTDHE